MPHLPSQATSDKPRDLLVVRFGSLGDLCLLGWSLARLADRPASEDRRVTLVTKAAFAPLLANVRGVHRVIPLRNSSIGAVARLAEQVRSMPWDMVIDAHNILRGHLLFALMRIIPDRRLAKDTAARLAFMGFGRREAGLERTMHDRFEDLTVGLAPDPLDNSPTLPPLASLSRRQSDQPTPPTLGLAPGAQWDTKRWPEEYFVTILSRHLQDHTGNVRIFLGPREKSWFTGSSLERAALDSGRTEIIQDRSLAEVTALLSECNQLVTNDSGLLHMAEAIGTPVLALFGPTVREFGYFPILPGSRVMERPLDCRPCSRNGKRPCHRGDLACLRDIPPDEVFAALSAMEDHR
jgi:heptosyltransferase-2